MRRSVFFLELLASTRAPEQAPQGTRYHTCPESPRHSVPCGFRIPAPKGESASGTLGAPAWLPHHPSPGATSWCDSGRAPQLGLGLTSYSSTWGNEQKPGASVSLSVSPKPKRLITAHTCGISMKGT